MKCPKCNSDLVKKTRYGIEVDYCTNDHGMWLDYQELDEVEDKGFKEDNEKGSLMLSNTTSGYHCPKCNSLLKQFQYRLYDLTLEYCENKDGYWLDAGEEERVMQLMKQRKKDMRRKSEAEAEWNEDKRHELDTGIEWRLTLLRLRSKEIFDRLKDLLH